MMQMNLWMISMNWRTMKKILIVKDNIRYHFKEMRLRNLEIHLHKEPFHLLKQVSVILKWKRKKQHNSFKTYSAPSKARQRLYKISNLCQINKQKKIKITIWSKIWRRKYKWMSNLFHMKKFLKNSSKLMKIMNFSC